MQGDSPFEPTTAVGFGAAMLRGAGSGVVDHRLSRQHLINEYRRGRLAQNQVCDAHPELVRAAQFIGETSRVDCPICEAAKVSLVTYVFGPRLPAHGKCVYNRRDMHELNRRSDDLKAYIVEVCGSCRWHHLLRVVPVGGARRPARPTGT
jgi:Family of unknown function (DUF5318)